MLEYSLATAPDQPIVEVQERDLDGCVGALVPSESLPRRWGADESPSGILQPSGVWFDEPVVEMCIRADRWDRGITILHSDGQNPLIRAKNRRRIRQV